MEEEKVGVRKNTVYISSNPDCYNKRMFRDPKTAEKVRKKISRRNSYEGSNTQVYRCRHCKLWHIGNSVESRHGARTINNAGARERGAFQDNHYNPVYAGKRKGRFKDESEYYDRKEWLREKVLLENYGYTMIDEYDYLEEESG